MARKRNPDHVAGTTAHRVTARSGPPTRRIWGQKLRGALDKIGQWTIEVIKWSDLAKGLEVLPRRWVVKRTFAWLGRCCRLAKDFEATLESAVAWITIASIRLITRRLARA